MQDAEPSTAASQVLSELAAGHAIDPHIECSVRVDVGVSTSLGMKII